jgi:hypothetical protein
MEDINKNTNKERTKPIKTIEKVENTIKPTKTKTPRAEKQPKPVTIKIEISYQNYKNNTIEFNKYKLPELKDALKKYNLKISGKKEELIERLETHFNKTFNKQEKYDINRRLIHNIIFLIP